mmetsp:Transcript_86908/g.168344  ORF Transcript_86908/g.168344 Transcript_86908/m.168344 type:complete len:312 (-) Transcript_86908:193-1128(-)
MSISCSNSRYIKFRIYVICMIIVYPVGIPFMYAVLLWSNRAVLSDQASLDREAKVGYPTVGHLKFLFEAYSPEYYFFEVLECVRRLLLASVIGLVAEDSTAAPVIGVLVTLVFLYAFTRWAPFVDKDDNALGIILAYSLTLLFLAALLIKADISGDFTHDQAVFGVILSLVILAGPCALVAQFTKRGFESYSKKVKAERKHAPKAAKVGTVQAGRFESGGKQPASFSPMNGKGGQGKSVGAGDEDYQGESKSFAKVVGADPAEQEGGSGPRRARSRSKSASEQSLYLSSMNTVSSLESFSLKQVRQPKVRG